MSRFQRFLAPFVALCIAFAGMPMARANGLISTEQVAASQGLRTAEQSRDHVLATLERADVSQALVERGVDLDQARARVAAMTDAEAQLVAAQIDSAPAGSSSFLGLLVLVFVILLITDILGFTKIFPFTRPIR
jgi:hypothetical protein